MSNSNVKKLGTVIAVATAASLITVNTQAAENPFGFTKMECGYMQTAMSSAEGKCGEGKCGEAKTSEGKCGEGKCGGAKTSEGKCGEGKCGGQK